MSNTFSCVAFDLGGVLLHLDYAAALRKILPLCDQHRAVCSEKFFGLIERDPSIAEFECGDLSTRELFDRFVTMTGYHGSFEHFCEVWRGVLSENPPMLEFGREIAQRYDTFLWSNAGKLHIPWVYEQFPALQFLKGDAVSCYLGAVKPNRTFYERALAKHDLRPEQVLFVDDRPENVAAAREMGIRTVPYTTAAETIATMRAALNGASAR
jgi:FMN phosphatase YigB (HAD superfamily)